METLYIVFIVLACELLLVAVITAVIMLFGIIGDFREWTGSTEAKLNDTAEKLDKLESNTIKNFAIMESNVKRLGDIVNNLIARNAPPHNNDGNQRGPFDDDEDDED
jgi:uncharacterized protein (UPF0333 family)